MSTLLSDPLLAVLTTARLAVIGLGLAVACRGLRGYRRTGSRPMLAFGVAFTHISLDPLVTVLAGPFLDARSVGYVTVAGDVVLFGAAFSLVLFALYRLA